ncbi:MAG: carboxypeptidase regulatory-like domain-containing protein [Caldilineaceae bacterium]|nr:carboxypeptidase regulatory-like domain-containing protein [Caldilineaceae bacterium]
MLKLRPYQLRKTLCVLIALLLTACQPSAEANVIGYLASQKVCQWTQAAMPDEVVECPPARPMPEGVGSLTGLVLYNGEPVANASVVVAEPAGTPHVARTDAAGRYQIDNIPPGLYVPAAVAAGYEEAALHDDLGVPALVHIMAKQVAAAPPLALILSQPAVLPADPAVAFALTQTDVHTTTAPFPVGAAAQVQAFQFTYNDAVVDTLRLYLPRDLAPDAKLPLLFMIYPTHVDLWETVSTAFASHNVAFVAISPTAARGVDIEGHALDANAALQMAVRGDLSPHIQSEKALVLGGSFSSAILNRLLRLAPAQIAGWVTVGGIADAFSGTADYYAGVISLPPAYTYAIPALGPPHIQPLAFLRYSPVYNVDGLPPAMIIHTKADLVLRIEQAYALEKVLQDAGVPVTVFYYEDVSHYLQIDENLSDAGKEMFYRILEFAQQVGVY